MILILSWLANAITLYILARMFPQHITIANLVPAGGGFITMQGLTTVLVGSLILGVLNSVLRPVLKFLSFPLTCLTLGLFSFIVTGFVFYLADIFTPGLKVSSFWWAIIGGALFGFINSLIHGILGIGKKDKDEE